MSNNARQVNTEVKIRGRKFAASEIKIEAYINAVPRITLQGHFPEVAATTTNSSELPLAVIAKEAADIQKYILETERISPDLNVSLQDGIGGSVEFAGFLAAPSFGITPGGVTLVYNGLHQSSLLSMYLGSIYGPVNSAGQEVLKTFVPEGASFAALFKSILDQSSKWFDEPANARGVQAASEFDEALSIPTHARNKKIKPYVDALLDKSKELTQYPGLEEYVKFSAYTSKMRNILLEQILAQPNLTESILRGFNSVFPCYFTPVLQEKFPGARLILLDAVNAPAQPLVIPVDNLSFTAGGTYDLPVKGVVVTTPQPAPVLKDNVASIKFVERISAYYPPDTNQAGTLAAGGTFVKIGAPGWIEDVYAESSSTQGLGALRDLVSAGANAASAANRAQAAAAVWIRNQSKATDMLERYAQSQYTYLAFALSQASVTLPLNLKVEPGRPYQVMVETEKDPVEAFTGFVQSVQHRVSVNKGAADASTTIVFSHVRAPGFTLPGAAPLSLKFP